MRPIVKINSVVQHETYVDLLLDQIPKEMGFEVVYLKLGDGSPRWTGPARNTHYSPPEISVDCEMQYPFDLEQNAQQIADWVKRTMLALNTSIRMIITSGDSHVTFRPVGVRYDKHAVTLSTRISVCVF
jgi:hypothetical protein